jgi:hypothetical protein
MGLKRLGQFKTKSSDLIGNRIRNLPAYSAVLQTNYATSCLETIQWYIQLIRNVDTKSVMKMSSYGTLRYSRIPGTEAISVLAQVWQTQKHMFAWITWCLIKPTAAFCISSVKEGTKKQKRYKFPSILIFHSCSNSCPIDLLYPLAVVYVTGNRV